MCLDWILWSPRYGERQAECGGRHEQDMEYCVTLMMRDATFFIAHPMPVTTVNQ
jgi:hypothetical protein